LDVDGDGDGDGDKLGVLLGYGEDAGVLLGLGLGVEDGGMLLGLELEKWLEETGIELERGVLLGLGLELGVGVVAGPLLDGTGVLDASPPKPVQNVGRLEAVIDFGKYQHVPI
jgi:hypothetical protein